jgi:hypothetical protein
MVVDVTLVVSCGELVLGGQILGEIKKPKLSLSNFYLRHTLGQFCFNTKRSSNDKSLENLPAYFNVKMSLAKLFSSVTGS